MCQFHFFFLLLFLIFLDIIKFHRIKLWNAKPVETTNSENKWNQVSNKTGNYVPNVGMKTYWPHREHESETRILLFWLAIWVRNTSCLVANCTNWWDKNHALINHLFIFQTFQASLHIHACNTRISHKNHYLLQELPKGTALHIEDL